MIAAMRWLARSEDFRRIRLGAALGAAVLLGTTRPHAQTAVPVEAETMPVESPPSADPEAPPETAAPETPAAPPPEGPSGQAPAPQPTTESPPPPTAPPSAPSGPPPPVESAAPPATQPAYSGGTVATAPRVVEPPPPPVAPPDPSIHRHDGFYFRIAIGMSYLFDRVESDTIDDGSLRGLGAATELVFGGTIAPGLVLGAGFHDVVAPSPGLESSGDTPPAPEDVALSAIGLFSDYYFDDREGLHGQVFAGYGWLRSAGLDSSEFPGGFVLGLGFGHEWWVGEQWSIGALGRVTYASVSYSDANETHRTIAPAVLATFTHH